MGRVPDETTGASVAGTLQQANDELKLQSDAISGELRSSVETLSETLASRVLGTTVAGR